MFSSFKTSKELGSGLLQACFLYVRIVFTAASSVCLCEISVEFFSPKFLFSLSLKWMAIKERERGRRTEETIHFEGLNRSAVWRLIKNINWLEQCALSHKNHKELRSSPGRSKKLRSQSKWDLCSYFFSLRWCKGGIFRLLNAVFCSELIPTNAYFIFDCVWFDRQTSADILICFICIYFHFFSVTFIRVGQRCLYRLLLKDVLFSHRLCSSDQNAFSRFVYYSGVKILICKCSGVTREF